MCYYTEIYEFRALFKALNFLSTCLLTSLTSLTTFEYFILLAIGANCIVLALNRPLPENDRIEMADKLVRACSFLCFMFAVFIRSRSHSLPFLFSTGRCWAVLYCYFLFGSFYEDFGVWIRPASRLIFTKWLEYFGLCGCCDRVSNQDYYSKLKIHVF